MESKLVVANQQRACRFVVDYTVTRIEIMAAKGEKTYSMFMNNRKELKIKC